MNRLHVMASIAAVLLSSCETYDPPPEVELLAPTGEGRPIEEPLMLRFNEPIDVNTLSVSIWLEDDIDDDSPLEASAQPTQPLVDNCEAATCPDTAGCDGLSVCVDADGLGATLTVGDAFSDRRGTPLLLVVNPGLADRQGNTRGTPSRYPFQFLRDCSLLPTGAPVAVSLNSSVVTLVASLAEGNAEIKALYPGLYLRLIVDMVVDPENGETMLLATVARLHEDAKAEDPTSEAPLDRSPILDHEGWALFIEGSLTDCHDGTFWLKTQPRALSIMVLGAIPVVLEDFQLTGTLAPASGEQGRDQLWGGLSASSATLELGDVSNFGAVAASFNGDGLFCDEVDADLPRLCAATPCALLDANGGDCQIPSPWTPQADCQCP